MTLCHEWRHVGAFRLQCVLTEGHDGPHESRRSERWPRKKQMDAAQACREKAAAIRLRTTASGRAVSHGAIIGGLRGTGSVAKHLRRMARMERAARRLEEWADVNKNEGGGQNE